MNIEPLIVPLGPSRAEITVVNSRFIASLDYVGSVEEARAFVDRVRGEFQDASHNVPAFIVGGGNSSTEFCSDDGEPSGTSGRPLLAVLRGSGLGNVAVVVTRYFGGTLLGTGGLVKAYSEAGRQVLGRTKRAALEKFTSLRFELPYAFFDRFRMGLSEFGATIAADRFAEAVGLDVEVPSNEVVRFTSWLADLSSGNVCPKVVAERMACRALRDSGGHSR
ncbi:MAG: YigZ family protein [Spirochaetales bacterium]|jgi:uncharacterized YigZ family protein